MMITLKPLLYFWLWLFIISNGFAQDEQYLPDDSITLKSSLNILKILTDHPETKIHSNAVDIDKNQKYHIAEILYPLLIQGRMITYEIHHYPDRQYVLKYGKSFASIMNSSGNWLFMHPDAYPLHHGFSWMIAPYILETPTCLMASSIGTNGIELFYNGRINYKNKWVASFNLIITIQINAQQIITGGGNIQLVMGSDLENETRLHLFEIKSTYLHDVPLIKPPDTTGNTGNMSHVLISGRGSSIFNTNWIPIDNPHLIKDGLLFMQIAGTKNLAAGHGVSICYPDFELTFSGETVHFMGQYNLEKKSDVGADNVSIAPYINVSSGRQYQVAFTFKLFNR